MEKREGAMVMSLTTRHDASPVGNHAARTYGGDKVRGPKPIELTRAIPIPVTKVRLYDSI